MKKIEKMKKSSIVLVLLLWITFNSYSQNISNFLKLTIDTTSCKFVEYDTNKSEYLEKDWVTIFIVPNPTSLIALLDTPLKEWIDTMTRYNYMKHPFGGDDGLCYYKSFDNKLETTCNIYRYFNNDDNITVLFQSISIMSSLGRYFDDFFVNIRLIQNEKIKVDNSEITIQFKDCHTISGDKFYNYEVQYNNKKYKYTIYRNLIKGSFYSYWISLKRDSHP